MMEGVLKEWEEVRVKEELVRECGGEESHIENKCELLRVKEEWEVERWETSLIDEKFKINVKEEKREDERGYPESMSGEGLYEEHEIKRELVLGPEKLQPQDITYVVNGSYSAQFKPKQEAGTLISFPKHETVENYKKHDLKPCSVTLQRIDYYLTLDQNPISGKQEKTDLNYNNKRDCNTCEKQELKTVTQVIRKELTSTFSKRETNEIKHENYLIEFKKKKYKPKKLFVCDFCGKDFKLKLNLVTHIRTHTGEKPYQCEICNKRFADLSTLIRHRRIHTGEKPYLCKDCNKTFSEKYVLENHRRIHTGFKPYSCPMCGKRFIHISNFGRHVQSHVLRPFNCDICDKRFGLETQLNEHILSHAKYKPFVCHVCEKGFIHRSHLNRHLKIHGEKKSYSCGQCNVQFSQKSGLKKHLKRQVCLKRRDARSY